MLQRLFSIKCITLLSVIVKSCQSPHWTFFWVSSDGLNDSLDFFWVFHVSSFEIHCGIPDNIRCIRCRIADCFWMILHWWMMISVYPNVDKTLIVLRFGVRQMPNPHFHLQDPPFVQAPPAAFYGFLSSFRPTFSHKILFFSKLCRLQFPRLPNRSQS